VKVAADLFTESRSGVENDVWITRAGLMLAWIGQIFNEPASRSSASGRILHKDMTFTEDFK